MHAFLGCQSPLAKKRSAALYHRSLQKLAFRSVIEQTLLSCEQFAEEASLFPTIIEQTERIKNNYTVFCSAKNYRHSSFLVPRSSLKNG